MMMLWRRSLAARFLLLVLFALALSQAITFLVSWGERGQALHAYESAALTALNLGHG